MSWDRPRSNLGSRGGRGSQGSARGGASRGGQQQKRQDFEPYWSEERVDDGIRRGQLIKGQIRIINRFDAYVQLPDDESSVCIEGSIARNRALNSDVVVVQLSPFDEWRVTIDEFELFEQEQTTSRGGSSMTESSQGTPQTGNPSRRFASVSEMKSSGSSFARRLFAKGLGAVEGRVKDFVQQTGKVVSISERRHSRVACGKLQLMPNNNNYANFLPTDQKVPIITIPLAECPRDFKHRPDDYTNRLYVARITQWKETFPKPRGSLERLLGESGQTDAETAAILINTDIDDAAFSREVTACLPSERGPWRIPTHEDRNRDDFRTTCVFTIDASKTKDLDDALSIEELPNGNYEVGVHISDVSYFVLEGTALDREAAKRAISVYLVNLLTHRQEIPMLPTRLSEDLCSLNKDQDRLTFSVLFEMNGHGRILRQRIVRSMMRSCARLTFEQAQAFIENPSRLKELPDISRPFTVQDVMSRVQRLSKIAKNLQRRRMECGALRLGRNDFEYTWDRQTGLPTGYSAVQCADSDSMIEEFMLLANEAVAREIKERFPEKALLLHQPPLRNKSKRFLQDWWNSIGLEISTNTAGDLQAALTRYDGRDEFSQARQSVLQGTIAKNLQRASHFCAGAEYDETQYRHFSLNVPLYTHFTSPIRQYVDIMVHRLLAASLGYSAPPTKSREEMQRQAEYFDDKKRNGNEAFNKHSDMYFSILVKTAGTLRKRGIVKAVFDSSIEVLILEFDITKRVFLNNLPAAKNVKYQKNGKHGRLELEWSERGRTTRHVITTFTMVNCVLEPDRDPLSWKCVILRPE